MFRGKIQVWCLVCAMYAAIISSMLLLLCARFHLVSVHLLSFAAEYVVVDCLLFFFVACLVNGTNSAKSHMQSLKNRPNNRMLFVSEWNSSAGNGSTDRNYDNSNSGWTACDCRWLSWNNIRWTYFSKSQCGRAPCSHDQPLRMVKSSAKKRARHKHTEITKQRRRRRRRRRRQRKETFQRFVHSVSSASISERQGTWPMWIIYTHIHINTLTQMPREWWCYVSCCCYYSSYYTLRARPKTKTNYRKRRAQRKRWRWWSKRQRKHTHNRP